MSLGDPKWEVIDPTPNVFALFAQFDETFFWGNLSKRTVVRWSKRMYSCAGICAYEGRGGLCDIALSEPLLKLRPRKDLVETLLHEMIHAYLFITGGDRDRDGHGPKFQSHMHRINFAAGLNISIYHDFHDEVRLYKTHWWRCNGPCHLMKPYFGIVKRSANRAPGPNDFWWLDHKRKCGGTFIKIKEPEKKVKNKVSISKKPMGDITKYLNNTASQKTVGYKTPTANIKTISDIHSKTKGPRTKPNGGNTVVMTHNNTPLNTIKKSTNKTNNLWDGKGYKINDDKKSLIPKDNIPETVRNIWANKQLDNNNTLNKTNKRATVHDVDSSPPMKMKKIDSYFSATPMKPVTNELAASILKDIYGEDFVVYQNDKQGSKMIPIRTTCSGLVNCPICDNRISSITINRHLDECLNKTEIEKLCNNNNEIITLEDKPIINNKTKIKAQSYEIDDPKPSTSRETVKSEPTTNSTELETKTQNCPCCSQTITISMEDHLEDCLSCINDNSTIPDEGSSSATESAVILLDNSDDDMDESHIFNETGTKYPCPCCFTMVEQDDMNSHLDNCLK